MMRPTWQIPVLHAALTIGILLMGIQLWLLTIALDLLLQGQGNRVWQFGIVSGGIFLGGIFVLALLNRSQSAELAESEAFEVGKSD